jgi:surface antigen
MRSLPIVPFALAFLMTAPAWSIEPAVPVAKAVQHWECVPIARSLSGIQIRGDAHSWWGQADGRYDRGHQPKRGAVLAFKPHGAMRLGHVAAVSRIVNDRTLLVTHSNWSRIDGRRGQIERDVRVVDVSEHNDWSQVRVWYATLGDIGTTAWPTHGFIYPDGKAPMRLPDGAVIANGGVQLAAALPKAVVPKAVSVRAPETILPKDRFVVEQMADAPRPTGKLAYLERKLARYK